MTSSNMLKLRPEREVSRGKKMPYSDFSIFYRAGKKRTRCKKREVNLTFPSRDIVPQRLRFTDNCIGSRNFKPFYLWTVCSTSAPLPE